MRMALAGIQIIWAIPQDKPYPLSNALGLDLIINSDGSKGWRFRFAGKARLMSFEATI